MNENEKLRLMNVKLILVASRELLRQAKEQANFRTPTLEAIKAAGGRTYYPR